MAAFITVAQLGDYLRRDLAADDLATFAVDAASEIVRDITEQEFDAVADEQINVDGSGTDALVLPQMPNSGVTEVIKVGYNGAADETVDADDYITTDDGILVRVDGGTWVKGRMNYLVTYNHGFADIPTSVQMVAVAIAARIYDQGLAQQESVGGYQVIYAEPSSVGVSDREREILEKYKHSRSR